MKNITEISPAQEKAAMLIVSGCQLQTVARDVGIHPRTLSRWLELPVVKNRIRALRTLAFEHSANKLQRLTESAIDCLERNLSSGNRASEVRSAVSILRLNLELSEHFDFDTRLQRIEQQLDL